MNDWQFDYGKWWAGTQAKSRKSKALQSIYYQKGKKNTILFLYFSGSGFSSCN